MVGSQGDRGVQEDSAAPGAGLSPDEWSGVLAHLLESSIDLLAVLDHETRPIALSRSWEGLLGWSRAELAQQGFLDLVHPDDRQMVAEGHERVLRGDSARGAEVRMRRRDGGNQWVQGGAVGDVTTGRTYLTVVDIHERKALEHALRTQLALEEVVASIASGLIGVEPAEVPGAIEAALAPLGRSLGVDRAHFLRASRAPDEVTYLEWYDPEVPQRRPRPDPDPEVRAWWRAVLRSGRVLRLQDVEELRDEAPTVVDALIEDGARSVLHIPLPVHRRFSGFLTFVAVRRTVPLSEDAVSLLRVVGECFLSALASSDDAIALEDARRELELRNHALERSNEELERFAYAAAHDLKAPLVRIEMALAAAPTVSGPGPDLIDIARRGAARMRQLIEDLLTFAAVGQTAGAPGEVDLDAILTEVLSDLGPALSAGGIRVERSPLPLVTGHRGLLGQLLQNLVGNAVKFARVGDQPLLWVGAQTDDEGTTITVIDNGIGIAPDRRDEVFGVFKRLNPDDTFPGSGIGLATCARVVEHHGGRIWLDDGIDGGLAVHVWLPHRPASVGTEHAARSASGRGIDR